MNGRTLLVVTAVAAAGLAGCSDSRTSSSAVPTTAPDPAVSSTTAAGPAASSRVPGHTAAPVRSTSIVKPAVEGTCTPSEATLLKALRASEVGDALAPTATLTDITCYQGYALGTTHPKEADDAEVVFHYTDGAWRAVSGGTSEYCDGFVPAAVRPRLKHC